MSAESIKEIEETLKRIHEGLNDVPEFPEDNINGLLINWMRDTTKVNVSITQIIIQLWDRIEKLEQKGGDA